MDLVQLSQGYRATTKGCKAESTLQPPGGFELGTPGLGIQRLNH